MATALVSSTMSEVKKKGLKTVRKGFYIPHEATKEWEQDSEITIPDIEEMRISPIIKFPLAYLKMPIGSAGYKVQCDDPLQEAVMNASLSGIWTKLMKYSLQKLDFGFQVVEPVYASEPKELLVEGKKIKRDVVVLKNIHPFKPADISINQAANGEILKIYQNVGTVKDFDLNEVLWFTNKPEDNYGSIYGSSELNSFFGKVKADGEWTKWKYINKFLMMDLERGGLGILKVSAPDEENEDGENYLDQIIESVEQLMRTGIIGLNSEVDPETKVRLFDVDTLKDTEKPRDYIAVIDKYTFMAFLSLLIPDKALTAGDSGTYNIGEVHADFLTEAQEDYQTTSIDDINNQIVPDLNKWNGFSAPCSLVGQGLTNEDKKRNTKFVEELIKQKRIKNWHVDWTALVESTGITAIKAELIQKDAEEEKKRHDENPNPMQQFQTGQPEQKNNLNNNPVPDAIKKEKTDEDDADKNLSEIRLAEKAKRNPAINLKKLDQMFNKANDLKKQLTDIIIRQRTNTVDVLQDVLKYRDKNEDVFLKKLFTFTVPYRRDYEVSLRNHMMGIFEEAKDQVLQELDIKKSVPMPKEKKMSIRLRAENIASQHINTLTYRVKNIVSAGVQNKVDNNIIIKNIKEAFDKFASNELKGVDHVFRN